MPSTLDATVRRPSGLDPSLRRRRRLIVRCASCSLTTAARTGVGKGTGTHANAPRGSGQLQSSVRDARAPRVTRRLLEALRGTRASAGCGGRGSRRSSAGSTQSRWAMPLSDSPSAIRARTSRSRSVRSRRAGSCPARRDSSGKPARDRRPPRRRRSARARDEVACVADAVLQQVAAAASLVSPRAAATRRRLDVLREHEYPDVRGTLPDPPPRRGPRRCASAASGCRRSRRRPAPRRAQQLVAVAGLAAHLDAVVGQQTSEALAEQRRVVGDHDPHATAAARTGRIMAGGETSTASARALDGQPPVERPDAVGSPVSPSPPRRPRRRRRRRAPRRRTFPRTSTAPARASASAYLATLVSASATTK